MDFIELIKAVVFGIIQGITEWLPISSTGHMILVDEFIKLNVSSQFKSMFEVVIQFGSILAVVVIFFHKLNPFSPKKSHSERIDTFSLWLKVLVAVIPAGVIGVLYDDKIHDLFFNSTTVAITLIVYGVLFIILESKYRRPKINSFDSLDYTTAILIGLFQVLSLIPGTSRSGSTILGAVFLGTSRYIAAEFSFFLAIPVMFGASALKGLKFIAQIQNGLVVTSTEIGVLVVGMIVAFLVSIFAIKFLMNYVKQHDFKIFGYYRILLGVIVLLYFFILK